VHHRPSLSFFLQILCGLDSISLHTIISSFKIRVLIGEKFRMEQLNHVDTPKLSQMAGLEPQIQAQ
jgi:hypothetical protein